MNKLILISDFTISNFKNLIQSQSKQFEIVEAPLGQVYRSLHELTLELKQKKDKSLPVVFLWTMAEKISSHFQQSLHFQNVKLSSVLEELDPFIYAVRELAPLTRTLYLPEWAIDNSQCFGLSGNKYGLGPYSLLNAMNLYIAEKLADLDTVILMNSSRWLSTQGSWSPKLWYMTKTPFSNSVFEKATSDFLSYENQLSGGGIKLVVLDLDDTLWGGIVGDDGWKHLRLGGHDAVGEAFVAFQRDLKALKQRGVLLALASKNEESVALEAIDKHPEMILRREDFVAWKINWQDKASNIKQMVQDLRLGIDSVLFIDDNPIERSRVREFLPGIQVPEWPSNKLLYSQFFRSLNCFALQTLSLEDLQRTKSYQEESQREQAKQNYDSVDHWLKSLETTVEVSPLSEDNWQRVLQLFNKTNQFNLSTRRLSDSELKAWLSEGKKQVLAVRVRDRFGDAGLTGIISLDFTDKEKAYLSDFILSCRVLGRRVEDTLLHLACTLAKSEGASSIEARLIPTAKNQPCQEFMQQAGFQSNENNYIWDLKQTYPCPDSVNLLF